MSAAAVVIEVSGGVAQVTSNPANVQVQIIDHDNDKINLFSR